MKLKQIPHCVIAASMLLTTSLAAQPSERSSLAAGRPVRYAPAPNYRLTIKGDTDATDLTDGELSEHPEKKMWFESRCVGFSHSGLQNLSVDIGALKQIDEVAIRFQGGSLQAGICVPGWIDVCVSDDGVTYRRVAQYSKWNTGDRKRFGVPDDTGEAWIHRFRFPDIKTVARYVGIAFYGAGLSVCDELYVYGGDPAPGDATKPGRIRPIAFSTDRPIPYFHKPVVQISGNIAAPTPIGLLAAADADIASATVHLDVPKGVMLIGGSAGGVKTTDMTASIYGDERGDYTRYSFDVSKLKSSKQWGRIFFGTTLNPGSTDRIRMQMDYGGAESSVFYQPVEIIAIREAPQPKRLMTGLGWWSLSGTMSWPGDLAAMRRLGVNTIPLFARWIKADDRDKTFAFLDRVRKADFAIMSIDSPFHHMLSKNKNESELYAQFEDGTTGKKLCPSYRGELYKKELKRLAEQTASVGANILSCDIELWGWRGPQDCEKCTRCQADFAASGTDDWAEWRLQKGVEIWTELSTTVREATRLQASLNPAFPKTLEIGGYDFQPGHNYQNIWAFDRLYPKHMNNSQVSTYTPLDPYHLSLIGDRVREDRKRLGKSDVLPWLTPGDSGTYPGRMFRYSLLECFANGARGVHFWSGRVWDTETLAAHADAIRIVTPVEDIIVDGELATGVTSEPPVRMSGMRHGNEMFVLVADYALGTGEKKVRLTIPIAAACEIIDLETAATVGRTLPDQRSVTVTLGPRLAIPLHIRPRTSR